MKNVLFIALMCCCNYLSAQNLSPIAIEDKKMDTYLTNRKPTALKKSILNIHWYS